MDTEVTLCAAGWLFLSRGYVILAVPEIYSLPLYIINCLTHVWWILAPELEIGDVNFFVFIVAELLVSGGS